MLGGSVPIWPVILVHKPAQHKHGHAHNKLDIHSITNADNTTMQPKKETPTAKQNSQTDSCQPNTRFEVNSTTNQTHATTHPNNQIKE